MPFAFNLATNDVFELTKQVTLRVITGSAVIAATAAWLARDAGTPAGRVRVTWLRSPAVWAAAAIVLAWSIATVLSVAPAISLWGSSLRWQGLHAQLGYVVAFLIASLALGEWRHVRRFAKWVVVVASLLALYGLAQRAGIDPLPWRELSRRFPIATFGNQAYLAAYLVQTLLLTFGLALVATGGRRTAWLLGAAVQALALLLSLGRGAWLGAAAGLAVFLAIAVARRLVRPRTAGALAGAGLAMLTVVFAAVAPLRDRLLSLLDPSSAGGTAALRLEYWPAALQHWLARPVSGYGPDTQSAIFEWRYLRAFQEEATDRAHNWLMDTLLTTGALGALALLAVCLAVALSVARLLRSS
ncbi:MAG TPA: O-antigen ligase family protein, partial [Chloroflexota bacterium]|nr:O-antigen ligase family protein [Chloroflexota bacterium]